MHKEMVDVIQRNCSAPCTVFVNQSYCSETQSSEWRVSVVILNGRLPGDCVASQLPHGGAEQITLQDQQTLIDGVLIKLKEYGYA